MPTYYARANGNVNAAIWATTPTGTASDLFSTFTNADTLMANGFTVTLNVNTAVLEVRNDSANSASAGGSYTLNNGVTLTANVLVGAAASCVTTSGTVSATVNGNIAGQTLNNGAPAITHNAAGTLTINGSLTGSSVSTAFPPGAPLHVLAGTAVINGSVTGGTSANQSAIYSANASNITISGTVSGGSGASAFGLDCRGSGTVVINGNCTGGAGASAVSATPSTVNATVTGNVTGGGASTAYGINWGSSGILTVNGAVTGGTNASANGVILSAAGTVAVNGTATGAVAPAVASFAAGTITVSRARGGPLASSSVGVAAATVGSVSVSEIEYGDAGASPTSGPIRLSDATSNVAVMFRFGTTKKTLVDTASTTLVPAAANVRSGITYNAGQTIGSCSMPPQQSVMFGVPVGATTGTAYLTPADFWNYQTSSAIVSGSMGERLASVATVASTGQQLADAVSA